jgi:hypothetical protein
MISVEQPLLQQRTILEIVSDHLLDVRITRQQRAIAMLHGDRGVLPESHGREKLFEMRRRNRAGDDAKELAVRPRHLLCDDGDPIPGEAALHQFELDGCRSGSRFEGLEEGAIGDFDIRNRPMLRRIDQHALRIEDVDAGDIGIGTDLDAQRVMPVDGRQLPAEGVGRGDASSPDFCDHVSLKDGEVFELVVEMTGQQQHGVFQLALVAFQRAFAKIIGHDRRADRDRRDQQGAANDKPADRTAANGRCEAEGGVVCRHGTGRCRGRDAGKQSRPSPANSYRAGMEVRLGI